MIECPFIPRTAEWVCCSETNIDLMHGVDEFLDALKDGERNNTLIVVIKRCFLGSILCEKTFTKLARHESVSITFVWEPKDVDDKATEKDDNKGNEDEHSTTKDVCKSRSNRSFRKETKQCDGLMESHQCKDSHGRKFDTCGASQ